MGFLFNVGVAHGAQFVYGANELKNGTRSMGRVAGRTPSLLRGGVDVSAFQFTEDVAVQAQTLGGRDEEALVIRGVGTVTARTGALDERFVDVYRRIG